MQIDPRKVGITKHALDRYVERIRPGLTRERGRDDLRRLLEHAKVQTERPSWTDGPAELWLVVGDLALPLRLTETGAVAVTVMARGGMDDKDLVRKRAAERRRRVLSRLQRNGEKRDRQGGRRRRQREAEAT